ncbi:TonB-dependent receptor [Aurantiacibacter xanthus]|uniref:TonB-dependent receptor n=1 Tax=Aurantiacibacter xanthus TaxID=1784712 RepID=UPI001C71C6DC|nr:TonB-dependent receptor plug domain-containing protein [Aurantiacibacter xanthus]
MAALGIAAPAAAQSTDAAAEDRSASSNAIVVTATRREQTLQEVPVAVSVVSGELLDNSGVSGVDQISQAVPSVTFTQGNNENNSSLNIRGIGTNVFSSGVEPSVSIVFDDVVMARAGQGFQDFIDVQRIEVLRGPQSTLFGKNASAGVVSVTTKDATDYLSGEFDAMYAEGNEYQVRGSVSGPITEGVAARVSGFYKQFDGMSDNLFNGDTYNGYEAWGVRGKVQIEATDNFSLEFIGDYRNSVSTPTFVLAKVLNPTVAEVNKPLEIDLTNTDVNVNTPPRSDSEQWGAQMNAEYLFGNDFVLNSTTAVRSYDFQNNIDVDATPALAPPADRSYFLWDLNKGTNNLTQYSQELRLESPDLGGFDFLIGAFAYHVDLDSTFQRRWVQRNAAGNVVPRSGQFSSNNKTTNLAAFVSGNVYLGDLNLFGGLRVLHEKLEWSVLRDPADVVVTGDIALPGAAGQAADFSGSASDTAVTGNIGARYDFGAGNVYASYARGYKGAGVNTAFASLEGTEPVEPETVDAFEVGAKVSTWDDVFSVNLALFYTQYQNYQAQAQRPNDITFELANAGEISTKGVEIETVFQPSKLTTFRLGATYMDAKIDEFPGGPCYSGQTEAQGCVNDAQDLSGADLPNAPEFRLTGFARQTVPFGDSSPVDGFVQGNFSYQSSVQFALDQNPLARLDDYWLVNASIGIESKDDNYSISLFVRNLFDQNLPQALSYSTAGGGRLTAQTWRNQERYFGLQGRFSF